MYEDKRTILPTGLLSSAGPKQYVPKPIVSPVNKSVKPAPGFINMDKEKLAADARYKEQQAAASNKKGKIICLRWHELGKMSDELCRLDQQYGAWLMATHPDWQKGYLRFAKHIVKRMHNTTWQSKLFIWAMTPLVKAWSEEMGYLMGGEYDHTITGQFLMWLMVRFFVTANYYRVTRLRVKSKINQFFKRLNPLADL